jgi:hypothetical protein
LTKPSERDLKWVKTLPKEYLYCRSLRHAWNPTSFRSLTPDEEFDKPTGIKQVIKRELECLRCDTIRQDFFGRDGGDETFTRIRVRYGYPKDYQFQTALHELERPVHLDYSVEMFDRF